MVFTKMLSPPFHKAWLKSLFARNVQVTYKTRQHVELITASAHSSVGRALDMKTPGCGFDSRPGQPNNYELSFGGDRGPMRRYYKNQAELSVVSSCILALSPVTTVF